MYSLVQFLLVFMCLSVFVFVCVHARVCTTCMCVRGLLLPALEPRLLRSLSGLYSPPCPWFQLHQLLDEKQKQAVKASVQNLSCLRCFITVRWQVQCHKNVVAFSDVAVCTERPQCWRRVGGGESNKRQDHFCGIFSYCWSSLDCFDILYNKVT